MKTINGHDKFKLDATSILKESPIIEEILGTLSQATVILNQDRRVVYANSALFENLGITEDTFVINLRPGNILNCINATKVPEGCGEAEPCKLCGANITIRNSMKNVKKETGECRVVGKKDGEYFYYDLAVSATPFHSGNQGFTILSIADISSEKRKKALERIFFHDIINIAGSMTAITDLIPVVDKDEKEELIGMLGVLSTQILDEIKSQQQLVKAENNELDVNKTPLLSKDILEKLIQQLYHHPVAEDKIIKIDRKAEQLSFSSDHTLLNRVLINMVKNALEATKSDGKVTIGCKEEEGIIDFWVQNTACMPAEVQMQIFQRSFSTKGNSRGLGTYSMKLLGEKYLGGHVYFTSTEEDGTLFHLKLSTNGNKVLKPANGEMI
ncbi:HAMP domain-containing histidine kinase [Puteibacter caeruleilacunae]|nr:HAMP domain-containing histidine kinase [Puteibacter caeruleilacunae]